MEMAVLQRNISVFFFTKLLSLSAVNDQPLPHSSISFQNTGVYSPFIHLVSGTDSEGSQVKHQTSQSQTLQISYAGLRSLKRRFMAQPTGGPERGGKSIHSLTPCELLAEEKIPREI